jgi:NADPH:quinone reductase
MRAVQLTRFGGPEVLELVETDLPVPGPGQALVRTAAAGINFFETLMRENRYAVTPELPTVLGVEAAGTVAAIGPGVTSPEVGARVAVPLFVASHPFGGYADYVLAEASSLVPLPDALGFDQAVALIVQGLTALHLTRLAPPAGRAVLISAAAGGVGTLLLQLARRAGARTVIAAASTQEKRELALSLGADLAVDYTRPGWLDEVRAAGGADIIYESVGGAVTTASLDALAPLGRLVVYGALNIQGFAFGVPELKSLIFRNLSLTGFALLPHLTPETLRADLAELFDLTVSGDLRVTIGGTYPLARAADAHRALGDRKTVGKLVLVP